ncbi:hypothetical protein RS030_4634 [Cryptosporidium xiaoi]|uniref:Uncharacterized protein n=1 Tax=Cryptosporidium xiaoi TaxID=659607 RepID=A0AAV9XX66_9CRYT
MTQHVDFLVEKYYKSRYFENTIILTHLNGISIICLNIKDSNNTLKCVEFVNTILSNSNKNGILKEKVKIQIGEPICKVIFSDNSEEIIYSNISGELVEVNFNVTNSYERCRSSSWVGILSNTKH